MAERRGGTMPSYFGCETLSNQIAGFLCITFLVAGSGCTFGWFLCIEQCFAASFANESCDPVWELVNTTVGYSEYTPEDTPSHGVKQQIATLCIEEMGFANNTDDFDSCVDCLSDISDCLATPTGTLVVGVFFLALSMIPCGFFCLCSSPPKKRKDKSGEKALATAKTAAGKKTGGDSKPPGKATVPAAGAKKK